MQRIVYKLNKGNDYWTVAQFVPYPKSKMCLLFMALHSVYDWIVVTESNNIVTIWDSFDEKHDSLENVSKLNLTSLNYNQIVQQWNENAKNPSTYLVFVRDADDNISLEPKDVLSKEDLDAIGSDKSAKEVYEKERALRLSLDKNKSK